MMNIWVQIENSPLNFLYVAKCNQNSSLFLNYKSQTSIQIEFQANLRILQNFNAVQFKIRGFYDFSICPISWELEWIFQ